MKGKRIRIVRTTQEAVRIERHVEPEDLKRLLSRELDPKKERKVRKHLEGCLKCALQAGRLQIFEHYELTSF